MTVEAAEPRSLLRRLYDWCLVAAHKPHALWTMGAVSFAESSFFPVPPDVMLIPMALARPDRAYVLAGCSATALVRCFTTRWVPGSSISMDTATRLRHFAKPTPNGAP